MDLKTLESDYTTILKSNFVERHGNGVYIGEPQALTTDVAISFHVLSSETDRKVAFVEASKGHVFEISLTKQRSNDPMSYYSDSHRFCGLCCVFSVIELAFPHRLFLRVMDTLTGQSIQHMFNIEKAYGSDPVSGPTMLLQPSLVT